MTDEAPLISIRNLSKTFVGRTVLRDFSLDVAPGEIRGLVGQNGSGKSTLIKTLAGYQGPDEGARLAVRGRDVPLPLKPTDPEALGFAFVHQDLGLLPTETVVENFLLTGTRSRGLARISWGRERRRVAASLQRFGVEHSPMDTVDSLSEVDRVMLAIVRALEHLRAHESGLLVLDEPTAYLPRDGIDRLFAVVREVAEAGFGVIFVTHRLDEVLALTSRVSVLRDGNLVADRPTAEFDETGLIESILGFQLDELYPEAAGQSSYETAFSARGVRGGDVGPVSFDAGRGEVLGLTGLLGMGWEKILYMLFGAAEGATGTIELGDASYDLARLRPALAVDMGMALLPADRQRKSGVGDASVRDNLTLTTLGRYFQGGALRLRDEARDAAAMLEEFDVRPPDPKRQLATLSGGNQQKVLLAKWFAGEPRIFLMHEPTQGVDIGAKKQIFGRIRNAAESGVTVIIASSEYEDLVHICDRIVVFRDGLPSAELRAAGLTQERLIDQCFRESESARSA